MDRLLDILEADPDFRCFVLDGQMAVLQDYLSVRPEQRERLVGLVRSGRIHVGPWYVLPDEFLVSGEALVRNLLLARRLAAELGVEMKSVGYLPDSFGHIGQMPQILKGFGADSAVVWRGFGALPHNEFIWEAPDGTRVLGIYLAREYYLGFWPAGAEQAAESVRRFAGQMAPRSRTPYVLEPYGGDHLSVDGRLPSLIRDLNARFREAGDRLEVRHGSLSEYVDLVRASAPPDLTIWRGEARSFGHDLTYLLPGVYSARLPLKRANADCQSWLERYAEPLQGLAWAAGGPHEARLLWSAWESLLQNHPHDSICGCSVDTVHRQMAPRFEAAREIAELLALESLAFIGGRTRTEGVGEAIMVYNPLAAPRTDTVRAMLPGHNSASPQTHLLIGPGGERLPFQARNVVEQRFRHNNSEWTEVLFTAPAVPGTGYAVCRLEPYEPKPLQTPVGQPPRRPLCFGVAGPAAKEKGHESPSDLRVGTLAMENRWLQIRIDPDDGSVTAVDRETGLCFTGLNRFEDGGDAGDEYNYSPPVNDRVFLPPAPASITLAEPGPARATFCVEYGWKLPPGLTEDRLNRAPGERPFRLRSYVTLYAGVRRLEFRTEWENGSTDHRLRVRLPLGAPAESSQAETAFGVVRRPVGPTAGSGSIELQVQTHPQQTFVSVHGEGRGMTVLNRGLPEYEVLPGPQGTVCLTLLRSVGWLGRGDLVYRWGGAGPMLPTPEAQLPGSGTAEYAVVLHAGTWLEAGTAYEAQAYAAPLLGVPLRPSWGQGIPVPPAAAPGPRTAAPGSGPAPLPPSTALVTVEAPPHVILSALKRSEAGDALLVRLVNLGPDAETALLRSFFPLRNAIPVNLAEERAGEPIALEGGAFACRLGPHQIVSIALVLEEGAL